MFILENIKCDIQFANSTEVYLITEDDIIGEDVSITSQCCDNSTFSIGGVYSSQLNMTFRTSNFMTNVYDIRGAKITVYTKYDTENDFISRGVFWITSASRYKDVYTISASDSIIWLDNIPTTEGASDALTLHLESYKTTLTYQARRIVLGTNAILLGLPCSTASEIGESIDYLTSNTNELIFDYEYPDIYINDTIRGGTYRHYHKDDLSVETPPRDHLSFLAQIYGGFAYAKPNGNITFGRFFRDAYDVTDTTFTISNDNIEIDTLDLYSKIIRFSPVKQVYNDGYGQWHYYTSLSKNDLYASVILENNPFLEGYRAENEDNFTQDWGVITRTIFGILNNENISADDDNYSINKDLACRTYIRPFSLVCHAKHRFYLGEHVMIVNDMNNQYYESTLTKIVWTFRGGYELSCTGGDTRMLSDAYKNSQAKKVQRLLERKINYYR